MTRAKELNMIKKSTNNVLNVILFLFALLCILPVILVVIISFSSQQSIYDVGFTFFPKEWSTEAYEFFGKLGDQIYRSYGVTLFMAIVGTLTSLFITSTFAYVISRPEYPYKKLFTFLLVFTMIFNGGTVPTYMINTQVLGLNNSLWALVLPMCFNSFYVIILRTFYRSIPNELLEAARIDGASQLRTFWSIMLPLSKPGLATIGMFTLIDYWNDWFLGMLYIVDRKKFPIQTLLQSIQNSMTALTESSMNALEYQELAKNPPTDNGQMALTVIVMVPILCAYPFFQKYYVKGLTVGGVKG